MNLIIPYRDPNNLARFLGRPRKEIAESITAFLSGALTLDRKEIVLVAGRIIQGAIKGNLMSQVGKEIKILSEKGKINKNYAETKYGFQSLYELLDFIDSQVPDEERFMAAKTLFYSGISSDSRGTEQVLNYYLFKLATKLTSTQIVILKISYDIYKEGKEKNQDILNNSHDNWLFEIAKKMGHGVKAIILNEEKGLIDNNLLTRRNLSDLSAILPQNARLTDLGIQFCERLEKYDFNNLLK